MMEHRYSGRAAIINDDPIFMEVLRNMLEPILQKHCLLFTIDMFQSPDELEKNGQNYDVCFADVVLQEEDGISLMKEWKNAGTIKEVIYVSDHDAHVFRSFGSQPVSYVRKAYLEKELDEAVFLYRRRLQDSIVVIPEGGKLHFLEPDQIVYLHSNKHYIDFHMADENVLVIRGKLDDMERFLDRYDFIRIHVSYLVNLKYIRDIEKNQVQLKNLKELRISGKYRERVEQILKRFCVDL